MSEQTTDVVHWFGEPGRGPSTLHGNGPVHLGRGSGDEDDVTCRLCLTLLARNAQCIDGRGCDGRSHDLHCNNAYYDRRKPPVVHGDDR